MSPGVGVGVVLTILVVLPLAAVGLARRWRDPPRERWGIPAEQREQAAATPEVVEFHLRREYGIRDERRWEAVRRAVVKGEAAPADLRPAARRYAQAVIDSLDRQGDPLWGRRTPPRWVRVLPVVVAVPALVWVFATRPLLGVVYLLYGAAFQLAFGRWAQARRRARAVAAVAANE